MKQKEAFAQCSADLREAYASHGTDGVLALAPDIFRSVRATHPQGGFDLSLGRRLVAAALSAADQAGGAAASIVNGLIAGIYT